jgi:DNA-directed RNA polymerase subunit RPC12/RpoP
MYAVVGCSECGALWVIEGDPETSECPRCGSRRPREQRRDFVRTDDADEAREARSRLLADRQGESASFDEVAHFAELEAGLDEAGPDDETYLEGSGLDPEQIEQAGESVESSPNSRSREETVRAALRSMDDPDAAAITRYCEDRGVGPDATRELLEKLVRSGEVTRSDGDYRLL